MGEYEPITRSCESAHPEFQRAFASMLPRLPYLFAARTVLFGAALLPVAFTSLSCGDSALPPEGQLVIHVTTDAVLPPAPGTTAAPHIPPLFDRLRVDVYRPGEAEPCDGCSRDFAIDERLVGRGDASFGLAPEFGRHGYRARARMFLSAFTVDGQALPGTFLDSTVALPAVEREGIEHVTIILRVDDLGSAIGTPDAPRAPVSGTPGNNLVGTWPGARQIPCKSDAREHEACIPGGAFWMGDPDTMGGPSSPEIVVPRLVVLSPFFLDTAEVTVGQLRASGVAVHDGATSVDPIERNATSPSSSRFWCTYTATTQTPELESMPVNCLTKDLALAYCNTRGGALPTEAQLAFVSSFRQGSHYPWGSDPPGCDDAVHARAASGWLSNAAGFCLAPNRPEGPARGGSGRLDRATFGDAEVLDLAGNLAEYALDTWAPWADPSSPCWQEGILYDPVCADQGVEDSAWVVRGGSWMRGRYELRSAFREAVTPKEGKGALAPMIGFRCTRPDAG